jgi:hypothetical protein
MNLEILSFEKAMEYIPLENSYGIRLLNSHWECYNPDLPKNNNWITINEYKFDDIWPRGWKEFQGEDELLNYEGWYHHRRVLFDENMAKKILNDFEKVKNKIENIVIHCTYGRNRSPAVGMALNDIYGWGIKGLEEKFPWYRKYIYNVMMGVRGKDNLLNQVQN